MRVAVVDIGTNSTRLLIADAGDDGVSELARESTVTRLGEGVDATGRLGDAPQERVFAVLERYAAQIAAHDCEASTAVMTSAVRDADNGDAFRATVAERFGLAGRTLSGDEEARYTFGGATAARPADDATTRVVIDIGGGSTELVCGAGHEPGFHVSTQIGVVRFSERFIADDPPQAAELDALAAEAARGIEAAVPADVRASAGRGDRGRRHRHVVRLDRPRPRSLRRRAGRGPRAVARHARRPAGPARGTAARERREVRGLDPERAPTIVAGVVILGCALTAFGLGMVEVSDRDILWGVALDLAGKA